MTYKFLKRPVLDLQTNQLLEPVGVPNYYRLGGATSSRVMRLSDAHVSDKPVAMPFSSVSLYRVAPGIESIHVHNGRLAVYSFEFSTPDDVKNFDVISRIWKDHHTVGAISEYNEEMLREAIQSITFQ